MVLGWQCGYVLDAPYVSIVIAVPEHNMFIRSKVRMMRLEKCKTTHGFRSL